MTFFGFLPQLTLNRQPYPSHITPMNFDNIIQRRGTGSIKWDRRPNLDPYWVADMDFTSPQPILDAIQQRLNHGVLGYAQAHESLNHTLLDYLKNRHGADCSLDQITHLGGLVPALSLAARGFTNPGDALITCTPVYYPFLGVGKDANIETITVPHIFENEKWRFDFPALEKAVTPKTKLFLLCNPQNPLGRSFTKQEIIQVAEFCANHNLLLVSDEIHCDLVFNEDDQPFFSALNLPEKHLQNLIVLQAPSKTYNIAGMGYAFAVIPNPTVHAKFDAARGHTLSEINCLAYFAAEAAYAHCEPWRQELLAYLSKNRDTLTNFVRSELNGCTIPDMEATYLALIDCSHLPIGNPATFLEKEAGLFITDGKAFGAPQKIRFNFGCSHSRVLEGLEKIKTAFAKL